MLLNQLYDTATLHDAMRIQTIGNSPIQRNQLLSSGYYLWMNVAYHLRVLSYDKWQPFFFKNDLHKVQLVKSRFTTLYNTRKPCSHNITTNTTINELNARILL